MAEPQAYIFIALVLNGILAGAVAARDPAAKENRWYALMCVAITYWALLHFLHFSMADTSHEAFLYFAASTLGWTLMVPAFLMFVRAHGGAFGLLKTTLVPGFFLVSGVFLSTIAWKDGWMVDKIVNAEYGGYVPDAGPGYKYGAALHLAGGMSVGLVHLFYSWRRTHNEIAKKRTLLVFFGMLIPLIGGISAELIGPDTPTPEGPMLAVALTAVNTIFIGLGMLRYRLFGVTLETTASTIVEAIEEGLLLCNSDGKIEYSNPSSWDLLDHEPNALLGTNVMEHIQPQQEVRRALKLAVRGRVVNSEGVIERRTGEETPIEYVMSAIRDLPGGPTQGIVVAIRDVGPLKSLINQLEEASRRLQEQVITDPLTGVYNRRYLEARLEDEFNAAMRYNRSFSLMMLDLDHFKRINDDFGHDEGDKLLKRVSNSLSNGIRASDVITRYGGDEFVILMPETPLNRAVDVTERLRKHVTEDLQKHGQVITASFGIATYRGKPGVTSAAELIRLVDQALLRSKEQGRNCIQVVPNEDVEFEPSRDYPRVVPNEDGSDADSDEEKEVS
jgi:diguanylate cyclase (GGDEF)-like protein/PAS domain S-box-containing protein